MKTPHELFVAGQASGRLAPMRTRSAVVADGIASNLDCHCRLPSLAAVAITGLLLGPITPAAFAQPGASTPGRLVFEVASIKPSKNIAGPNQSEIAPGGQRFTATNASLKLLIMIAYEVSDRQVSDGPGWLNSEFYDVEAKAEHPASRQQIHLYLSDVFDMFDLYKSPVSTDDCL